MNSVTDSTQNDLTYGHRCLTAWILEKDHNITRGANVLYWKY